jgi:hypothetical protein
MLAYKERKRPKGGAMERLIAGYEVISQDGMLVHNWRAVQLKRLGLPGALAEIYADRIDWHQVARLVDRGCPARLALRIVC